MEKYQKTAIVTGASSGLGKAIAKVLINDGMLVYGLARNKEALLALEQDFGDDFIPIVLDISILDAVKNWVQKTFNEKNLPDILINNAGVGIFGKIDELPNDTWLQMINTNLNGMYYLTSHIVPFMKKNNQTTNIINIGSILGTAGRKGATAYATTKFGLQGFSESLFKELRDDNIKVTCLNPGSIESDFFKESGVTSNNKMLQPKDIAETILHLLKTPDTMLISSLTIRPLMV